MASTIQPNTPIRILQVVTILNRGGLETMLMNHYRVMDRDVIQFDFLVHREEKGAYDEEVANMGGRIYRLPAISPLTFVKYKKAVAVFFAAHLEYRIIHSHLDTLSTLILRAAQKAGVPCRIAHSHNSKMPINIKAVVRILSRALLVNYCTHHFACSEIAGDWLFGEEIRSQGKLILFRNAINTSEFSPSHEIRENTRRVLGLHENALVVGHVARFDLQKNHTFLLDIFADLVRKEPRSVLLLVGDGPLRKSIEDKAISLGIADRVHFLGVRSDIPELFQAMDVFVFPSLFEGLPVTVIEAQASGLHSIMADTISTECDLTGNVIFLPLTAGAEVWANEILKQRGTERQSDAAQRVTQAGYDVQENARWLTQFYLDEYSKHTGLMT